MSSSSRYYIYRQPQPSSQLLPSTVLQRRLLRSNWSRYPYNNNINSWIDSTQRRFFSNPSSVSGNITEGNDNSEINLTTRIKEINDYIDAQISTMNFFQNVMNVDPNEVSDDPNHYIYCRNQLLPLITERTPPKIYEEMLDSTHPTPLLHVAIRQSRLYTQLAQVVLRRGYYNAKCHPWMIGWTMIQGQTDAYYKCDENFYIQRYQGLWRYHIIQKMIVPPKIGTMIMYDHERQVPISVEYSRTLRTHYSNAPTFPIPHTQPLGNVHVALGFNDLQILLEHVDDTDETRDASSNISSSSSSMSTKSATSMKFIGYDRSTYSIAKSLVIAQMLQQSSVSPHHIIEAWYSSTWNYETFMLFRYACITLLTNNSYINQEQSTMSYPGNINEEIRQYLHHWAYDAIPISSVEAIRRWLLESSKHGQVYTHTCSFHRYHDRMSLLQYFMTGEFNSINNNRQKDANTTNINMEMVGSMAMWNVPDWAPNPHMTDQDRVNNTVLFQSILDEMKKYPDEEIAIVTVMYNIKLRQVTKLQSAVQRDEIRIDLRYGDIQPMHVANHYLVDEIRDLQATTMSWSNLVDYFDVGHFHELAHHWSNSKKTTTTTTHYGYTMNWPTTCYGTSISDYPTTKDRAKILFATIAAAKQESIDTGVGELVTVPSFEHTEDQCGELLAKQLRPKWVEYFIKQGIQSLPTGNNIIVSDTMQLHSPLLRTNRSIYLSWTYQ